MEEEEIVVPENVGGEKEGEKEKRARRTWETEKE